jgi:broad specificity phosphatase PhoE
MPNRIPIRPFYILRHGETDWNLEGRVQGRTDIPLNDTGREQARRAAQMLADISITTICTSPLDRASETATIIQEATGSHLNIIPDLQEVDCGENEGKKKDHWYSGKDTDWLDGISTPIGGESFVDFRERILCGVGVALDRPGPVLIVSHGQVIWALIRSIGARRLDVGTPNAMPMYFEPMDSGWSLDLLAP